MVQFVLGVLIGAAFAWCILRRRLHRRALEIQHNWHSTVTERDDEIAGLKSEIGVKHRAMAASERRVRYLESALTVSLQNRHGASV